MRRSESGRRAGVIGVLVFAGMSLFVVPASPSLAASPVRSLDKAAQSDLRDGAAAAVVYFTDTYTLTGFDAAEAAAIEPSITWADGDAVSVDVVNIGRVTDSGARFMLETLSPSGTSFCIAGVVRKVRSGAVGKMVAGSDTAGGTFKSYHGCRNSPSGSWW